MREVDNSLRRLGTDHVDIYLLHAFDDATPLDETLRAMDDVVTAGKARYIGCCNFASWQVCKALWTADRLNADPIVCVQNPYSLLNRALENEMFGLLRDQGLGAMAYSPMAVARLTGARALDKSESGDARDVVAVVRDIAAERGKTMAQVALNWVLSHQEITVAIAGCDTVEQVDENLGALGWELDEPELARLNSTSESLRRNPITE
jgi:aryl-alcohol dehydrogenase-like predicted oxidoreductase